MELRRPQRPDPSSLPLRLLEQPLLPYVQAAPALALSFWLLQRAHAPDAAFLQQALAIAGGIILVPCLRLGRLSPSRGPWLAFALACSLWLPLALWALSRQPDGPARWLSIGGIRLYLAPVVLPLTLFWLAASPKMPSLLRLATVAMAATALTVQPDAAQLTAFAVAIQSAFLTPRLPRAAAVSWPTLLLFALLLPCLLLAWRTPDPLAPVTYVEGVFTLSANASPLALLAALASAALPVTGMMWLAWAHRYPGAISVAAYYATLFALAPLQVTPVPLLGFGAGPILGYFLVISAQSRLHRSSTPSL